MRNWYAYDWELQGLPASFHVNLSYADEFDSLGDFTTLLLVTCFTRVVGAGAFTAREKRELDDVCKDCVRTLGSQCAFVGWIEVGAQRRYYFYTSDARLLVPLMGVCADNPLLKIDCARVDEPNRQTYYRLLMPDNAKKQSVDNEAYIRSLRARGDDNAAFRRVNLHFYFPTQQDMQQFAAEAKQLGFAVGADDYIPEQSLPYYVSLHQVSPLNVQAITALTTKAIYASEQYGGVMEHFDSAFIPKRGFFG